MPPPPAWIKRRSSKKQRLAVLHALRGETAMTPGELAGELRRPRKYVCCALDDLMVRGQVECVDGKFRRLIAS
jgi:hypothetical protein